MAKPKFTPDPVPDGMDPQLAEYLSRQLNRIEDWWPKDYEERIQALEQLAPYCTGTWPIVDYSSVVFGYEIVTSYALSCAATSTTYVKSETAGLPFATGFTIHGDRIVVSRRSGASGAGVIGTWDIGSSTWTQRATSSGSNGAVVVWHRSVSASGTVGVGDYVFYGVYVYSLSLTQSWYMTKVSDWSNLSATGSQGEQTLILDESRNSIGTVFSNGNVTFRLKGSIGSVNATVTEPTGWTFKCGVWMDAQSNWGLLYSENSTGDLGWAFVSDTYTGTPTPSKTKLSQFVGQSWVMSQPHWRDGDRNIYFYGTSSAYKTAHDPTLPNSSFIIKFDEQGDLVKNLRLF